VVVEKQRGEQQGTLRRARRRAIAHSGLKSEREKKPEPRDLDLFFFSSFFFFSFFTRPKQGRKEPMKVLEIVEKHECATDYGLPNLMINMRKRKLEKKRNK